VGGVTTVADRWIHLPAAGGGSDVFRADQPGGAGIFQVSASNAALACRENGLRTIWEDRGSANVYAALPVPSDASSLNLDLEDSAGAFVRVVGRHRLRLHGETGQSTRLHLACRGLAPSGHTLGVMLVVCPDDVPGIRAGLYGTSTTTSTTMVDLSVTLDVDAGTWGREVLALRGASGVEEIGLHTGVTILVAAWCTSGSGAAKAELYGLSVSVREP
jgi:hypothetical protein